ncbi:hypothetical protein HJC23_010712 [Cyclotella cryptica]|uniref:MORN repeat-containing protein n=1 Tax=Cyclotella cryptica TaxID=29204 RepID=A0ABD3PEH3_9STRA|eukprot:CCRYP_015436-RA/>CCRYP_015436-RA protein AED:0.11 eAED:0.11 QI:0/-1/0/1/-1/1/1/0/418
MSDLSSNTNMDAPPPPIKRSRGSSEETTLTTTPVSSGQSSIVGAPQANLPSSQPVYSPTVAAAIIEAARRYEYEAIRRNNEARARLEIAKEDVDSAVNAAKRAQDRLRDAEQTAAAAAQSCKAAREYVAQWEEKFPEIAARITPVAAAAENDDHSNKHVSFAPLHSSLGHSHEEGVPSSAASAGSLSASTPGTQRKIRRKRIRVAEHGWGTYEGMLDSLTGEPQGRGTVTWENGGKYSGDWVDGKAHGHGVMDYSNGDKYEGDWKEGSRYGHGTHHFKDGGVYCGQWRNAAPHGQGKMTLGNGSHYVGAWKDGKWHGHGIVRPVNGGEWEGVFACGKCTTGTLRRPNGEIEIGRYDSVNPDDVKEGVWWSVDRTSIWSVVNGDKVEEIDVQEAMEIANRLGIDLPKDVVVDGNASTEV